MTAVKTAGAPALKVPKKRAQEARLELAGRGMLRTDLLFSREGAHVIFPLKEALSIKAARELAGQFDGATSCVWEFVISNRKPNDYREVAAVPSELRKELPRSYDIIGKILIVKIPDALAPYTKELACALMEAHPEIETVASDGGVKGTDRIRDLQVIGGKKELETVHVEHGLKFAVDPSKVYFSPRLATERRRVAGLVREGETIIDLFAGVGPFAIQMARVARPGKIYAVDINPAAVELMIKNIRLNKVAGIEPLLGDARVVAKKLPKSDRIIMNLPHSAHEYLPEALALLKTGGTIHLYEILDTEKKTEREKALRSLVENAGRKVASINCHLVRGYSTVSSNFVFDIVVE